jgi:hypothetical protein
MEVKKMTAARNLYTSIDAEMNWPTAQQATLIIESGKELNKS